MAHSLHRIRRLRWVISTDSVAEAFTLRQCLHDQWQDLLLSACETAFNEAVPGEDVIHIPKLKLHLTVSADEDLMQMLPDLIRHQLKEQLQILQPEYSDEPLWGDLPYSDWQTISSGQNAVDLLLHYLRTGSVSWHTTHILPTEIAIILRQACQQQYQPLLDYLCHNPESIAFYFRLLQLLPKTEWLSFVNISLEPCSTPWRITIGHLVEAIAAPGQSFFTTYQQPQLIAVFLSESLQAWATRRPFDSRLVLNQISHHVSEPAAFYAYLLQQVPLTEWLTLIRVLLESLPAWGDGVVQVITAVMAAEQQFFNAAQQHQVVVALLVESLRCRGSDRPPNSSLILAGISEAVDKQSLQAFVATLPPAAALLFQVANNGNDSSSATSVTEGFEERSPLISGPLSPMDTAPQALEDDQALENDRAVDLVSEMSSTPMWAIASTDEAFPLSVRYAGLVLIHPFISHYFDAVGIETTAKKTIASEAIPRAAALLHFLAVGTEAIYEYELGLIKVLLGLKPDTPLLVSEGLLQASDREEAEDLLQSVIHYWSALKNTSVNGLRTSFLQRPGLLRETEDGWHLQVEPQAFDMLLNYLPWAIGIIKFSWMPKPLYTEWLTP